MTAGEDEGGAMIPLSQRSLDPETCVAQGGHCFERQYAATVGPEENRFGKRMRKIVEVCRHCPAYRENFEPPPHWVEMGEVQIPGVTKKST
jgi:hypothetical protein